MHRSKVISLVVVLGLSCWACQARSLTNGRSGHVILNALMQDDYAYTYGDLANEYDAPMKSLVQQRTDRAENAIIQGRKDVRQKVGKRQHEVLDDSFNYDYTYGDPEVSYDHYDEGTSRDEKGISHPPKEHEEGADGGDSPGRSPDKGKTVITPLVASVIEWVIRNWKDVRHVKDTWVETKDHVQKSWKKVKHSLTRITNALGGVVLKFGEEAEEGLKYCLVRLKNTSEEISAQGLEAINKLENLLEEGNELAASFFRLIGSKLGEIARKYSQGEIFTSDLQLSNYFVFDGMQQDHTKATIPNLFEDKEVLGKLNLMVKQNVLRRDEVEALLSAVAQQTQRATGKTYPTKITLQESMQEKEETKKKEKK
ncbi:uncharacterized protein LOC135225887 isoform X2 [Macrobrachium nipponense]|uniref:uncharacterized protein LOC135225887 isoform X2 n=1 Tax=Macrobrachium nipponense TaxID=159736 RepID=UPI0030C865CA